MAPSWHTGCHMTQTIAGFTMKLKTRASIALLAMPLLLAASIMPARANTESVVLVHGAFVDGSSWNSVISQLEKQHLEVIAVQLPLTSLADDVAATRRAIARAHGDVVLVGHSWGGRRHHRSRQRAQC